MRLGAQAITAEPVRKCFLFRCRSEVQSMKSNKTRSELSSKQRQELLEVLQTRFERNMSRHDGVDWGKVQKRLEADAAKLWSLHEMARTGGEPDVVWHAKAGMFVFVDCSAQSPSGRRSV